MDLKRNNVYILINSNKRIIFWYQSYNRWDGIRHYFFVKAPLSDETLGEKVGSFLNPYDKNIISFEFSNESPDKIENLISVTEPLSYEVIKLIPEPFGKESKLKLP